MTEPMEFEKPALELEARIEHIRREQGRSADTEELKRLEQKVQQLWTETYARLTPWQRTQVARHAARPTTLDYLATLLEDFTELHGDRLYGDDPAIVGGLGIFCGRPVVVIGHQKGRSVKERVARRFGMPHPEGYRKAQRLFALSERFQRPLLTFLDTPGAYPGIEAEERGQASAIAQSLLAMSRLKTPIVVSIIGEGGSGGALAMGVGDRVLMLEHAIYSVISPEGCAAILWKDSSRAAEAATALRLTSRDLLQQGVVDEVIPEPFGGAHRDPKGAIERLGQTIQTHLAALSSIPPNALVRQRYERFRRIGALTGV